MKRVGKTTGAALHFTFEGEAVTAYPGDTVATALSLAGFTTLRRGIDGQPRGVFCAMGQCQECRVEIDNLPHQRACRTLAQAGMVITQVIATEAPEATPPAPPPFQGPGKEGA